VTELVPGTAIDIPVGTSFPDRNESGEDLTFICISMPPTAPTSSDRPGLLFCEVGADRRAAGSDPASREAFTFVLTGLHDNRYAGGPRG
jgi:hypothetical protein